MKISIAMILLFGFFSCKSSEKSMNRVNEFARQYLKTTYPNDTYKIVDTKKSGAPGGSVDNYSLSVSSELHPRYNFLLSISESKKELSVNDDGYHSLLMEQAFIDNIDFSNHEDFPCVIEPDFFRQKKLGKLETIKTLGEAKTNLMLMDNSQWYVNMYVLVNDIESEKYEIEDMVINYANLITKKTRGEHIFKVFLYENTDLNKADIKVDMNLRQLNRTPHQKQVNEQWNFVLTEKSIKEAPNGIRSLVTNKKVIEFR